MSQSRFYVVDSPKVQYVSENDVILASYDYQTSHVEVRADGKLKVTPLTRTLTFRTSCRIPRVGCMLIGWGGNNGSTVTATVLANKLKLKWETKEGVKVRWDMFYIWCYSL